MGSKKFDISQITDYLYISVYPVSRNAADLQTLGIGLILNTYHFPLAPVFRRPPFHSLWLPSADHPWFPMSLNKLQRGVEAALEVIALGKPVLSNCHAGRHRSVALACCILIARGYSASEAMRLVKQKRPSADPDIWYIKKRILQYATLYQPDTRPVL